MSFGINGPSPKFGIQEAQNMRNNGGGGNLGYFKRQNKNKKKKEDEIDVFQSADENDVFVPEEDLKEKDESLLQKASDFIKMFKKPKHSS
ncbi:MAG: hypothetical protein KHX03_05770 [Clostridium sp.]|nr:hypothetical protein [Clostridium sp.]